ncbi:MAG: hypothetical protein IGS38_00370 [Synechococcales cyanobacterium M58_A2018_015]|nr:hypothetical protein [Synechococcales cyanobacterium M58_A2018_015]
MYVIQVNQKEWLTGFDKGWVTITDDLNEAAVYSTLLLASEAIELGQQSSPQQEFAIYALVPDALQAGQRIIVPTEVTPAAGRQTLMRD